MKKYFWILACFLLLMLSGCGQPEIDPEKLYEIYYLNNGETRLEQKEYLMELPDMDTMEDSDKSKEQQLLEMKVGQLLSALAVPSSKLEYKAPLAMDFSVLDYSVERGKILLNLDEKYLNLPVTTEVLVRAAIVRTLAQLPEINFVSFQVEGSPLTDSLDNMVGWMSRDQFIENKGNEINTYQEVTLRLYFTNEAGDGLIAANRTKEYNTNISMEKLIVEELIKGPVAEGIYPTINPATKVASVTVKDGVCYVNLDENFLTQPYNVTADVTIYSITNSLAELSNVNKVQISVNGDNTINYREKYTFTTYFERNLDMVINRE